MKTAWHVGHRIRLAMAPAAGAGPLGGEGKTFEADETYLTKSTKTRKEAFGIFRLALASRGEVVEGIKKRAASIAALLSRAGG